MQLNLGAAAATTDKTAGGGAAGSAESVSGSNGFLF